MKGLAEVLTELSELYENEQPCRARPTAGKSNALVLRDMD
ncbi:protein of unknown function [Methylococcus capsulatus]|uniref:Uncharacterized protein n=1 Tax=Methylococcus capsulatus TaxID=414 RepID=A0AA35UP71_METCP|nr:protein of unknown function [Methylococcus capsulatus]